MRINPVSKSNTNNNSETRYKNKRKKKSLFEEILNKTMRNKGDNYESFEN